MKDDIRKAAIDNIRRLAFKLEIGVISKEVFKVHFKKEMFLINSLLIKE